MDEKEQRKKEPKDRLEKALLEKTIECEVDGRKLTLHKWTLRQGIKVGAKVVGLIKELMPTGNVADLMTANVELAILDHEDDFVETLVASVQKGNFDTEEQAQEWVESLSPEDALELFTYVGKLNIRPLMERLSSLGNVVGNNDKQSVAVPVQR